MSFWKALKETYGGSIAFPIACPLLALVPVAFELIQHVVEVRIGLYDSIAAAKAMEHDAWRMTFGMLKSAIILVAAYWVIRYLAARDAKIAAKVDPRALGLFAIFVLFELALTALELFVLPETALVGILFFLVGELISCLVAAWAVAAALGNSEIGPVRSARLMVGQVPWTFGLFIAAILPLMVPHYIFAGMAIVGPHKFLWPVLIVDSLLVGWLTLILAASSYVAAKRAADRSGIGLAPKSRSASPAIAAAE
jgi:hypothetical protein